MEVKSKAPKERDQPGTTPLVAMALIDMAVNSVCVWKKKKALVVPRLHIQRTSQTEALTQQQHMKTMQRPWSTPAFPTTQVSLRNRMTPKMFWRQGR